MNLQPGDIASAGVANVDLLGPLPALGLTGSLPLTIEAGPAASPGATLLASPSAGNVNLTWGAATGATSYRIRRCTAIPGPCNFAPYATSATTDFQDPVLADSNSYWYIVDAVNSCGASQ